jgi:hypothetical protein
MAYKYILHPRYKKETFRGVILNKQRVNIVGGDFTPPTLNTKGGKKDGGVWREAKQKDLEQYYNEGLRADGTSGQKVVIRIEEEEETETTDESTDSESEPVKNKRGRRVITETNDNSDQTT